MNVVPLALRTQMLDQRINSVVCVKVLSAPINCTCLCLYYQLKAFFILHDFTSLFVLFSRKALH